MKDHRTAVNVFGCVFAIMLAGGCVRSGTDQTQAAGEAPLATDQELAEDIGEDHGTENAKPTLNPVSPEPACSKEGK